MSITNHDILHMREGMEASQSTQFTQRSTDELALTGGGGIHGNLNSVAQPTVGGQIQSEGDWGNVGRSPNPDNGEDKSAVNVTITAEPIYGRAAVQKKSGDERRALRLETARSMTSHKESLPIQNTKIIMQAMPTAEPIANLTGSSHLIGSQLPSAFPRDLAFQALAAYGTLRSLSVKLRLSPFSPNAFLRALSLPCECKLLGDIHAAILRILFSYHELGSYYPRGDGLSKLKLPPKKVDDGVSDYLARRDSLYNYAGENLLYLNHHSWPLYYMDYASIHNWMRMSEEEGEGEGADSGADLDYSTMTSEEIEILDASLDLSSPSMNAIFRSQPSCVDIRTCYAPYKTFPWMWEVRNTIDSTVGDSKKGRKRNGGGRNKRRRKSDDSSDESDAYEPEYEEYSHGSRSNNKRKRPDTSPQPPQIKFCVSEMYPRPVTADVHDAILNYMEEKKLSNIEKREETTLKLEGAEEIIGYGGGGRDPNHASAIATKIKSEVVEVGGTNAEEVLITKEMKPVKMLGRGKPYYSLKPEMKLYILEYLLDELLDVNEIRDILTARHNSTIRREPYEKLPTSEELKEIVNQDICAVCQNGGDLICCDGCSASYHRHCINISPVQELDGKKWFCPECSVVDVAKVGSIDGGLKSSIDWFRLIDLQLSEPDRGSQVVSKLNDIQMIIIHGFVFVRHSQTKRPVSVIDILSQEMPGLNDTTHDLHSKISAPVPLQPEELFILLKSLGPSICALWPFAQIPFKAERIWGNSYEQCQPSSFNYNFYSEDTAAFNPYVYVNRYRNAPSIPLLASRRSKYDIIEKRDSLLKIHNESFYSSFSRNTSKDLYLSDYLRKDNVLINPLKIIQDHFLTLERTFNSASLLNELWGYRNKASDPEWWNEMVSGCKNYKKLAKLLVQLIDDVHSRAFRSEWFVIPGVTRDDFTLVNTDNRVYLDLPKDWTPEGEKMKRKWEQSHVNDILGLVSKEQRSDYRKSHRRFKKNYDEAEIPSNVDLSRFENASNESKTKNEPRDSQPQVRKARRKAQEEIQKRPATRRSKDAKPSRFAQNADADSVRKARLFDLESNFTGEEREGHWPIAGRKLFAPSGSLPLPVVKWLGRNAGIKRAPGLRYTAKFEVGLPSVQMIWREKTLSCNSFEGLMYQLDFLDSYLDKAALTSCEKLSSRTGLREHIQKTVMCSRLDQDTGLMEHFVVHKNKWRGCWQNCLSVDSSAFIVFRSTRVKEVRAKLAKRRPKPRKEKKTTIYKNEGALNILNVEISVRTEELVKAHKNDVKTLMIECNNRGMGMIPSATINPLRADRCEQIRKMYTMYGVNGTILLSGIDVNQMIQKAEEDAKESYLSDMKMSTKKEPSISSVFSPQTASMNFAGSASMQQLPLASTQSAAIAVGRSRLSRSGAVSAQSDRTLVTSNLSTQGIQYQTDPLSLVTVAQQVAQSRTLPVSQTLRDNISHPVSAQLMQQESFLQGNGSLPSGVAMNPSNLSHSFPPIPAVESAYAPIRNDPVSRRIDSARNPSAQYLSRQMEHSYAQNQVGNNNVMGVTANNYYDDTMLMRDAMQPLPSSSFRKQQRDLHDHSNYHNSRSSYGGVDQPQRSAYDLPNAYDNNYQAATNPNARLGAPASYQNGHQLQSSFQNNNLQSMSLSHHDTMNHRSAHGQGMSNPYHAGQNQYSQLNASAPPGGLYQPSSTQGAYQSSTNGYIQQNQFGGQMHQNPHSAFPPGSYHGGQF